MNNIGMQEISDEIIALNFAIKKLKTDINEKLSNLDLINKIGTPNVSLANEHSEIITMLEELEQLIATSGLIELEAKSDSIKRITTTVNSSVTNLLASITTNSETCNNYEKSLKKLNDALEKLYKHNNIVECNTTINDPNKVTPYAYVEQNVDETVFSNSDSVSYYIDSPVSNNMYFPLCVFRAKSGGQTANITINIKTLGLSNGSYRLNMYLNDSSVSNQTVTTNNLRIELNNVSINEGNYIHFYFTNVITTEQLRVVELHADIEAENVIIVSKPKKYKVDRFFNKFRLIRNNGDGSFDYATMALPFPNRYCWIPLIDRVADIALLPNYSMGYESYPYDYQYSILNKYFIMDSTNKEIQLDTNVVNVINYLNLDGGPGNTNFLSRICGGGLYSNKMACTLYNTKNKITYLSGFTYQTCGSAILVKDVYKHSRTSTSKIVSTDYTGKTYFLNGDKSTSQQLYLGFGTNVTAYYANEECTMINVYMRVIDKTVRVKIDCSQATAVIVSKEVIGDYDVYYLLYSGYCYQKGNDLLFYTASRMQRR